MQHLGHLVLLASALSLASPSAKAENDSEINTWFAHLAAVNRPIFAEPAGSHGAFGLSMGAGVSQHQVSEATDLATLEFQTPQGQNLDISRIWLVKGLPWPIDVMFSGGQGPEQSFTQASLALQWNAFEQFALPTLAIRASRGGIFGCEASEALSDGLELVTSYAPWPYLNIFAAAGAYRHNIRLHVRSGSNLAHLLREDERPRDYQRTWNDRGYGLGIKLVPLPPFVAISAEVLYSESQTLGGAIKLSFGL